MSRPRHHWGRRLLALFLLIALVAVATTYIHYTNDEQIRKFSIQALEAMFGGQVRLRHAIFSNFSEIRITQLDLYPRSSAPGQEVAILTTREALIRIDPLKLLMGKFRISEIVIRQGHLNIRYDRDKRISNLIWSHFSGSGGPPMVLPVIYLRNCAVEYQETHNAQPGPIARQELTGNIRPIANSSNRYEFRFESDDVGVIQQAKLEGHFDLTQSSPPEFRLAFQLKNTDPNNLPTYFSHQIQVYKETNLSGEVTLDWTYKPTSGMELELDLKNAMATWPLAQRDIQLHDINTQIHIDHKKIKVKQLRATAQDHCDFYLQGTLHGLDPTAALDLELGTEHLIIPQDQWGELDHSGSEGLKQLLGVLPAKLQNVIKSLSPTGTLDIALQVKRQAGESQPIKAYGTVNCHQATMIYEKFPYLLQDISGTIQFSPNEVIVGPLISNRDDRELIYKGEWHRDAGDSSFNMIVQVKNLPLDEKLYQALDTKPQAIWDQFQPQNKVNATYLMHRTAHEKHRWHVDAELLGVNATYQNFPIPVRDIQGTLAIDPAQTKWDIHSAQAQDAQISLTGKYLYPKNQEDYLDCEIKYSNATIDKEFFSILPESTRKHYRSLSIKGQSDGQVNIRTASDRSLQNTKKLDYDIKAQIHKGQIDEENVNYRLQNVEAQFHLVNDQITIQALQANHGSSKIELWGHLNDPNDYQLHIEAQSHHIDTPLRQLVQSYKPGLWDTFSLVGKMNFLLDIEKTHDMALPSITGLIEPNNVSFRLAKVNYLFEKISGKMIIEPNNLIFDQIKGQSESGKFSFSGTWPRNGHDLIDLHLFGNDIEINEKLLAALPEPIMNYFKQIELKGRLEADLAITCQNNPENKGLWNIDGSIKLSQGHLTSPMPSQAINVTWNGRVGYQSDGGILWSDGVLEEGFALIKKRELAAFQARILYDKESEVLTISDINAQLCQGQLGGQAKLFFPENGPGYELQLVVREVDLKSFLESGKPSREQKKNLRGSLEGQYNLSKINSQSQRTGFFQFEIKETILGELPITAVLLNILNLSLPKEGAFNEVRISGNILGQSVWFDNLFLKGSAMSLQGVGQMTEPGHNLDLIFLVGSPHNLPPILGFTDLFTAIKPALLHIRVSGSFEQPKVDTIAFAAFRKLLSRFAQGTFLPFSAP